MMTEKTILEKNSMLVREFDKYILEHPEFADCIPEGINRGQSNIDSYYDRLFTFTLMNG
jgi:hypothetical protein